MTPRPITLVALAAAAAVAGCGPSVVVAPDTMPAARVALIPTFTPLPPATATLTPIPSPTATQPYTTPTPDPFEAAGLPVHLEIPAIGVNARIEHVGRLPNDQMDVPKIPDDVAWFNESALPGQPGRPAVINGHLDSPAGPAVFYELRRLVPGDELAVTYANGDRHVFVVEDKERYAFDRTPAQKIYGQTPGRMLNLITCDGAWEGSSANYQQRLVVYTRYKGRL